MGKAFKVSEALRIKHIRVDAGGTLYLEVEVALEVLYVTPQIAQDMLQRFPNLAQHVCVNDNGPTFGADIEGTWSPHLLEHLIIELQATEEARRGFTHPGEGLTGHTSWLAPLEDTRGEGVALMQVVVRFHDDLLALAACKQATSLLNAAFNSALM